MKKPLFSIVMPSFNQYPYLEEAVRSVMEHQHVDVELLVFDPGSEDGSRELLLQLEQEFAPALRLFLEPDRGQSDAVNKGMGQARGQILGWLNSDDRLLPGTLEKVAQHLPAQGKHWLYGQARIIDSTGHPCSSWVSRYKNRRSRNFSLAKLLTENFIPQMAVFWTRDLWEHAGPLNPAKHLDMDYDLWLRFAIATRPLHLPEPLADFRVHQLAKGTRKTGAQLKEAYLTACQYADSLGLKGRVCLLLHRLYSMRTRLAYLLLKP